MPFILNPYWESSLDVIETAFTFRNPPPSTIGFAGGPFLFGWYYFSALDRTIEQIGVYETSPNQNSIGIWEVDSSDPWEPIFTFIYQFIHDTSNPHVSENFYNWYPVPNPLTLLANHWYVIAAMWGEEPFPANLEPEDFVLSPRSGIGSWAFNLESRPLNTDLSDPLYFPNDSSNAFKKAGFTTNLKLRRNLTP